MPLYVKIILITMGLLVLAGIIYSSLTKNNKARAIKANPGQTNARIVDKSIPKVTSSTLTEVTYQSRYNYEFEVNGKKFTGLSERYNFQIEHENAIMNKTFPVIYDEKDPQKSSILILQRDFEEYDLVQPDSLKNYEQILK